jgi:general secretion pathway protein G
MRRSRWGFTLVELLVVVCIVALLALQLNRRLQILLVEAEHASAEHLIGAVRSAVALEVARLVLHGDAERLRALLDTNPMERLAEKPGNYLGELDGPNPAAVEGGHWYFDRIRHELVYRVQYERYVNTKLGGPPRIRFKYRLVIADSISNEGYEPSRTAVRGLTVHAVEPYRWVDPRGAKRTKTS